MKRQGSSLLLTLELVIYALLPPRETPGAGGGAAGVRRCGPEEIRGGVERFADAGGTFRVLFPGCLSIAAPAVLFRLKREGFSRCTVRETEEGLYVEGMR